MNSNKIDNKHFNKYKVIAETINFILWELRKFYADRVGVKKIKLDERKKEERNNCKHKSFILNVCAYQM